MNKKGQIALLDVFSLPKWLMYPMVILICLVLLAVVFFLVVVGYSCLKGNCNAYYGMGWFGYHSPIVVSTHTEECYENGVKIPCPCYNENGTGCGIKCYKNGRMVDC